VTRLFWFGPGAERQAAEFIAVANTEPIAIDSETVEAEPEIAPGAPTRLEQNLYLLNNVG
jgi:hypothetical protein